MSTIFYILTFVLVLGIIVLVHEFGHFIFARRAGILCHEFSIGMGPALYKIKRGETTYAIRAIPIGGYVSMAGEDPQTEKIKKDQIVYLQIENNVVTKIYFNKPKNIDVTFAKIIDFDLYGLDQSPLFIQYENEHQVINRVQVKRDAFYVFDEKTEMQIAPYERSFESKTWMQRFLTVVAGAGFNFILAIIIFIVINLITGVPVNEPVIGSVSENSPAYKVGLKAGDKIISMNDTTINKWSDISNFMDNYQRGEITIRYIRDGETKSLNVTPRLYMATIGILSTADLDSTEIGVVTGNSTAEKAGLKQNDIITRIEGVVADDLNTKIDETKKVDVEVENWYEINEVLKQFYLAETVNIYVNNEDKPIEVTTIKALYPENVTQSYTGISQDTKFNPFISIFNGVKQTAGVIGSVFQTFDLLFNNANVGIRDLSGPVGIYDMTKTFALGGLISLLGWMAFISANIGFVNLLPLPALDGGRLIFLLVEGVIRKPISRKVEGYIHSVGFILFMMLFLFITFNDILRIRG